MARSFAPCSAFDGLAAGLRRRWGPLPPAAPEPSSLATVGDPAVIERIRQAFSRYGPAPAAGAMMGWGEAGALQVLSAGVCTVGRLSCLRIIRGRALAQYSGGTGVDPGGGSGRRLGRRPRSRCC